jgi:hypothetical protein
MDAYLSKDAETTINGLCILGKRSEGLLIGHRRGHRVLIEKIFPSQKGFYPSLNKFEQLNRLFKGKILGFYAINPDEKTKQKILAPFAYGKVYLEVFPGDNHKTSLKSYSIEYVGDFVLSAIPLVFPKSK